MTDAEREAVVGALTVAAEIFGEAMTAARMEGYVAALDDLAGAQVIAAIAGLTRTSRYFPRPADIRDAAIGSVDDRAELAWRRVLAALEQVGTNASVDFGDPILHAAVVDLGGWADAWQWQRLDDRALGFVRTDFVRLYRIHARHGGAGARILQGVEARQNALTRGAWTRGTDHIDVVLAVGPGGESLGPAALPAAERRRALPARSAE